MPPRVVPPATPAIRNIYSILFAPKVKLDYSLASYELKQSINSAADLPPYYQDSIKISYW
ncbi:hypothetical protein SPIROBIBN47_290107 [uncultured spirochete]|uniref:Uncharacterized protein n=1 Tax=uncultured spirochete TaxID=156406 RepID=A0A3P3XJA6_9SPIR|nr:hypothetical protein SPIROBIBN47_290107 [uncultured spirochete]